MVDTKIILQVFSQELIERMEARGVTHRQLAFDSRTKPLNILGYMRGDSFPNAWTLVLMAECLECTVDDLLGYEDNGFVKKHNNARAFDIYPDEDSFTPYLRERIIQRMKQMRMTAEELARESGVTYVTINRYLCVHSGLPRTNNLLYICEALDCTPSELIGY